MIYDLLKSLFIVHDKANVAHINCVYPELFYKMAYGANVYGCHYNPSGTPPDDMVFVRANISGITFTPASFQLVFASSDNIAYAIDMLSLGGLLFSHTVSLQQLNDILATHYHKIETVAVYRYNNNFYLLARRINDLTSAGLSFVQLEDVRELENSHDQYPIPSATVKPDFYLSGAGIFISHHLTNSVADNVRSLQSDYVLRDMPSPLMPVSISHLLQFLLMGVLDGEWIRLGDQKVILSTTGYNIRKPFLSILSDDGKLVVMNKSDEIIQWLTNNVVSLRNALVSKLDAQYDMKILPEWGEIYDRVIINGKQLLKTQELAVTAILELLIRQKAAFLIGSPSVGKTIMSITVIYALHLFSRDKHKYAGLIKSICERYSVSPSDLRPIKLGCVHLIYTPAILPKQWAKEISNALGDQVNVRVVSNAREFNDLAQSAASNPDIITIAVMSYETLKLSDGECPAYNARYLVRGKSAVRSVGKIQRYMADPTTGKIIIQSGAPINVTDGIKKVGKNRFYTGIYSDGEYMGSKTGNHNIREPIYRDVHRNRGYAIYQQCRKPSSVFRDSNGKVVLGGAVFPKKGVTPIKPYKIPLADIIKRTGNIGIIVVDEAHRIKSMNSMVGSAVRKTFSVAQKVLMLTATFSSGTADSFFYLIYPFSEELRRNYAYDSAIQFAKNYGNVNEVNKILAGISPKALRFIADKAVFVDIPDLGKAMPDFEEKVVVVSMNDMQKKLYAEFTKDVMAWDDVQYAFLWLIQRCVPDQAYKDELLFEYYRGDGEQRRLVKSFSHSGIGKDILPKELELAKIVRNTLSRGERAIVYCTQSDTRTILERLEYVLRQYGANPFIMRSTIEPLKRHDYIDKHVRSGHNVLICNPRTVQEGVNLIDFTDIIFYDAEMSPTTTIQASRRTWRITQPSPKVTVYYMAYRDTPQVSNLMVVLSKCAYVRSLQGVLPGDLDDVVDSNIQINKGFVNYMASVDIPDELFGFVNNTNQIYGYAQSIYNTPENRKTYGEQIILLETDDELDAEIVD